MPNIGQNWQVFGLCDLEIWQMALNKTNLRNLIAVTGLTILLKLDSNRRWISPCDLEIWWMTLKSKASLLQSGNAPFGSKLVIFLSHTTLKNKRAHLLCYFKLCESFHSHLFKLELQSGNAKFGSKSAIFMPRVTLKFDGWPSKTIGHLFYATSSLVHHFIAIGQFKLGFQSGNPKFWSKSAIFCHVWPW